MAEITHVQNIDELQSTFYQYEYALLYKLSSVELVPADSVAALDEECYEARFFRKDQELHIFRDEDGEYSAVIVADDGSEYLDFTYELANAYKKAGQDLIVRKYLEQDKDGQVQVVATRLVGIK